MKAQAPEGASPQPEDAEPYERVLEFVRAEQADAPYAFHFKQQDYRLRTEGGATRSAHFPWNEHLLADLETLAQEPPASWMSWTGGGMRRLSSGPTAAAKR
jgi:hypothetical protein